MTDNVKPAATLKHKIAAILIVLIFGYILIDVVGCSEKVPVPNGPPISVSAIQLTGDFHSNILAAEKKYAGKRVAVSGTLDYIDNSGSDIELGFRLPAMKAVVRAAFKDDGYSGLDKAMPGDWVSVLCDNVEKGYTAPRLEECVFVPKKPT